jgi:hypothetical protein
MPARKTSAPWLAIAVLVVLIAYVPSYYATVVPQYWLHTRAGIATYPRLSDDAGGGVASGLFFPIHWLDRRIRPDLWER